MSIRKLNREMKSRKCTNFNESELLNDVDNIKEESTVPSYIERISMIIRSEEKAIEEYDVLLSTVGLPDNLRDTILEIQNDEKDHLVLLTNMLSTHTEEEFPDNTDELELLDSTEEYEEDSLEINDEEI